MLMNVQILRAFAACLVVWAHLSELFPGSSLLRYTPYGLEGVDLFFVISGFIMVYTTSQRVTGPLAFLFRRFLRIAPLYYIATLLVILIFLVMPAAFKSTEVDLPSMVKSALFIPYQKSEGRIYPLYYLGWTLNYEMFFYLMFSIAIWLRYQLRTYICSAIILALTIAGLFIHADEYGILAYVYTRPIMLDFVLGMLIAQSADVLLAKTNRNTSLYVGLGFVGLVLMFSLNKIFDAAYTIAPITNTFFTQGVPAAMLVLGAVLLEKAGRATGRSWLTALGDASYSLYLFHFFMVAVIIKICDRFLVPEAGRVGVALVSMPLICLASYIIYVLLEKPMHRLSSKIRFTAQRDQRVDATNTTGR